MGPVVVALLLLTGCGMAEGIARCRALYGPDASYNGLADRCVDMAAPMMMPMVPLMLNPAPSPRYTAPAITPMPMNRCQSLVIGNQVQTTCY